MSQQSLHGLKNRFANSRISWLDSFSGHGCFDAIKLCLTNLLRITFGPSASLEPRNGIHEVRPDSKSLKSSGAYESESTEPPHNSQREIELQ